MWHLIIHKFYPMILEPEVPWSVHPCSVSHFLVFGWSVLGLFGLFFGFGFLVFANPPLQSSLPAVPCISRANLPV